MSTMDSSAITRARNRLAVPLAALLLAAAGVAHALTVSPSSLTITQGGKTATITVSGVNGTLKATSANPTLSPSTLNTPENPAIADAAVASATSVKVTSRSAGYTVVTVSDGVSKANVQVTVVTPASSSSNRYNVLAWNDLGMHCVDGRDYSVFSILPPYNNLIAQLVDRTSWTGAVSPVSLTGSTVLSNAYLTYESAPDAKLSTINTWSGGATETRKTNFWVYAQTLYGVPLADNCGLTGNFTTSKTPRKMAYATDWTRFEANGIPITPLSESLLAPGTLVKNEYPPVKVVARNSRGTVLASTVTELPVSDEITCKACHASDSKPSKNLVTGMFAEPAGGWDTSSADPEKAWKLNILKRHDELSGTKLLASANSGTPVLCAGCHGSNALNLKPSGAKAWLTEALHSNHANVTNPGTTTPLNDATNRDACYLCHPGSSTQCLRGAMSRVDAVQCQSCHGNMANVGKTGRVGWLDQPTCQACHYNGQRLTAAVDASGNLTKPADARFATNANVPAAGFNLYRFSKGHGGMQCESCHGSTHAEYPSREPNDNAQSIALQGYAGTVRECLACHATKPEDSKLNRGPHGMHWVGPTWIGKHGDIAKSNLAECAYCHVTNYASYVAAGKTPPDSAYKGSPLSAIKVARTFRVGDDGGGNVKSFAAGQPVGCYDCHSGPRGD